MLNKVAVFTRKRALTIVISAGALILLLLLLRYFFPANPVYELSTADGREKFLLELGWQVDMSSEAYRTVTVPNTLEGVMETYNEMQIKQGYDLNKHLGERCQQYTYVVTNYPNTTKTVLVTIYVKGNRVIAGDVHTASADGFMHGLSKPE